MSSFKTTKKHFELFKKECEKWINFLGLSEWEVEFLHENAENCLATATLWDDARMCKLTLSTDWPTKPTNNNIKEAAQHEVTHVLLRPLVEKATYSFNYYFIEPIEHGILHRIQKLMSGK